MKYPFQFVCGGLLALASCSPATAQQLFAPLAAGVGSGGVYTMLADPNDTSRLFLAGAFSTLGGGTISSPKIGTWNGSIFGSLGCGLSGGTWDCVTPLNNGSPNPVFSMAFWNGELYAAGYFDHSGSVPILNIARWDGSNWQPLLGGIDGPVFHIRSYPDGLYAAGWFDYADTVQANGLARWDGTQFHRVHNLPLLDSGSGVPGINDMTIYNGTVYVAGNFGGGFNDIAYFDGNAWVPMGDGFRGAFSTVNLMEVRDDKLYIAGSFNNYSGVGHPDNPGNGIVVWDGSQWDDLLGGTDGAYNPAIYGLEWILDTLHVIGRFDKIGGVPTGRIAKWDGYRWCGLVPNDYFYPDIACIGQWHDTLYVGGSFTIAGPDTINRIGKWIGGSYTDTCGFAVGIAEQASATEQLLLYPNPVLDVLHLNNALPAQVTITDATGRQVMAASILANGTLPVGALASGCYMLHLRTAQQHGWYSARFVKQ